MELYNEEFAIEEEMRREEEILEHEECMWAHNPETGERTFYLGCVGL